MRAYPTVYKGIEYRSRIEARWASFFTHIGWRHIYEPFDGNGYIPDFLIEGDRPLLIEIKPATGLSAYQDAVPKIERGLRGHWQNDVLILGISPVPQLKSSMGGFPRAGLLGEGGGDHWVWGTGLWFTCRECGGISVFHHEQLYSGRPCGHYDGDHHLGQIDTDLIERHWARACNDVKWYGKSKVSQ